MMYISAFPLTLTMRSTNVYEERSLGIYAEDIKRNDKTEAIGFWVAFLRDSMFWEGKATEAIS